MTTLAAVAACSVLQITALLRKKTAENPMPSNSRPGEAAQPALPVDTPAGKQEAAALTQALFISRADWGAAAPLVTPNGEGEYGLYDPDNNPTGWMVYTEPLEIVLTQVIIHHSALPLSDGPREIQRLHTEEKGFADIGYHFLIDETGQCFEGRSLQVRGAHTYGANYGSIGICLLGNFEELQPPAIQLDALRILLTSLVGRFPGLQHLSGHRDHNPGVTLCPGANLYPLLPGLAEEYNLTYGIN